MANKKVKYDFSGYVTKNDVLCTDGRRIRKGAFQHQNGEWVPMVWQHQRNSPDNVIGKVLLEDRNDGVYGYGVFNSTPKAELSKTLVEHGDITHMSIFANQLLEKSKNVMHGEIREVSLVLAGANPGAVIDNISIVHADGTVEEAEGEAYIYTEEEIELSDIDDEETADTEDDDLEHADGEEDNPTFKDVYNSLNKNQKTLLYAMVQHALDEKEDEEDDEENGGNEMKQSVFDGSEKKKTTELSHEDMQTILKNAERYGSMRMAVNEAVENGVLQHSDLEERPVHAALEHGITNIEYLFEEDKLVRQRPDLISRPMEWVAKVYDAASKSPFSRIKSMAANITADEARARGYIKGKKKTDEQFALLKRSTSPQTVYKKQSFDRDDIADITSFDVINWVKGEMKIMLREEIGRAMLVGDGRPASSDDKINPINIRPIYGDEETYVIYHTVTLPTDGNYTDTANAIIDGANYARIDYKGTGTPVMFTTSKIMTDMILAKDKNGRRLYNTKAEIASALRVADIIEVPVIDGINRTVDSVKKNLLGIIVNMRDYTVGATEMGKTTMFDDFDIDYNKQKYLIETRMSGALTVPYSAICLEAVAPTVTED